MVLRLALLFCFLPTVGFASTAEDIRVRLVQQQISVTVTGQNLKLILPTKTVTLTSPLEIAVGISDWTINKKIYSVSAFDVVGTDLKFGTVETPELLHFVRNSLVGFDVITELPLENYLLDVVASEVPSSWPIETLKAQAVAARSYALFLKGQRSNEPFHVDSTTQDQVFIYKRHLKIPNSSVVISAVQSTARQVLVDANGDVIKTFFHAHCGGETEDAGAVWPEYQRDPNFKRTKDVDSCSTTGAWSTVITEQQILDQYGASAVVSLTTKLNKDSERVEFVEIVYVKATKEISLTLTSQDFRKTFGYTKVRSTIFKIQKVDGTFELNGRGFGHGVGMCQTGARWMGASGTPYVDILSRYYAGSKLTVLP